MDCLEGIKKYSDKYFELAIVDPPYGIGESNKNRNGIFVYKDKRTGLKTTIKTNYKIDDWDLVFPSKEYFIELIRISKNQIIWGANHFIENIPNANSSSWIVWDKCNGDNDFADCELAWTSFKKSVRQFRYMWSGMLQGKQSFKEGHIFEGNTKLHEKRIHKTHKPIILYKWLLENYAKSGDKIIDTHLGSGSSRIAAYDMGFDFIGYELDKDYFDAQNKRFNEFKMQTKLF